MPEGDDRLDPGRLNFPSHPHVLLDSRFIIDACFGSIAPTRCQSGNAYSQLAESSQVPVEVASMRRSRRHRVAGCGLPLHKHPSRS